MRRATFLPMSSLLVALTAAAAPAGPPDDLLPRPVRPIEKRLLGGEERNRGFSGRTSAVFSPDGKTLLAATDYQAISLYDVATFRNLGALPAMQRNDGVAAAFTPDGKQLIATNWGGHQDVKPVGVWDVARQRRERSLDEDVNDTQFTALAVSPDGRTLALASGAGNRRNETMYVALWDLASGDEIGRITALGKDEANRRGGYDLVQALAYAPDGRTLALLRTGRVHLVETASGKGRGELTFPAPTTPQMQRRGETTGALAFAPDGRTLAVGDTEGTVRRFDLRSGRELPPLPGHTGPVPALCWTPDGKSLLSFGADAQFFAWRADSARNWKPKNGPLSDSDLEALWDVVQRSEDALDQYGAVATLAAAPAQTVPYLSTRVAPIPKGNSERIDQLIADIQKGDYNARKRAVIELRKNGAAALPALRKTQERGYEPFLRHLMMEFEALPQSSDQQRSLRALPLLEAIGNADARKLLADLAGGAAEAPLTIQAKAALERLGKSEAPAAALTPDALWEALAGEDSLAAQRAMRTLAQQPTNAAMLLERLQDAKDALNDDPKRVAALIADLDSDDFAARERASKSLRNLGPRALSALRTALDAKAKDGLEIRRRLEELIEGAAKPIPLPPELLRVGRVLETLELMEGAEGTRALTTIADKGPAAWLRDAAGAALRRQRLAQP